MTAVRGIHGGAVRAARPRGGAVLVAALLVALLACGAARASPPIDAAAADLAADGVHVSPRALGVAAPEARRYLLEARAELVADRRVVAFAIVPGPVGSPGMTALARRLHREADLPGALMVTGPGRGLAFWGLDPRPPVIAAIAASGATTIGNPYERLERAARIVVPPRVEPDGVRELLVLLLLAGLGAAWAVAWGAHRTDRQERTAVTEARMQLRVWIDALRAQAMAVSVTQRLAPRARREVEGVLALCTDTLGGLHDARTLDDVTTLGPRVARGFDALDRAGGRPHGDPFAGLCAVDPSHGAAVAPDPRDPEGPVSLCRDCRAAADGGVPPAVRQVPVGNAVVPYTAVRERGIPGVAPPAADNPAS